MGDEESFDSSTEYNMRALPKTSECSTDIPTSMISFTLDPNDDLTDFLQVIFDDDDDLDVPAVEINEGNCDSSSCVSIPDSFNDFNSVDCPRKKPCMIPTGLSKESKNKNNKRKFCGGSVRKNNGRYDAYCWNPFAKPCRRDRTNGKQVFLGSWKREMDAAIAHDLYVLKLKVSLTK